MLPLLKAIARWLVPYEVYVRFAQWKARVAPPAAPPISAYIAANAALRNIEAGKRAFILCNGPSVNRQNLLQLKGELVFAVSNGYLLKDYLQIAPRYHCVPGVGSPQKTHGNRVAWFHEMHERLGGATVVLTEEARALVESERLFPGREVRYLRFGEQFESLPDRALIDIARPVPRVQSVPIMALMVAMYTGANPIYLLGVEHDHFRSGRYVHAYQPGPLHGPDPNVGGDGTILNSLHDEFEGLHRLWRQYRALRRIAEANGVAIYNATDGGALDEFPRVRFESLFGASR